MFFIVPKEINERVIFLLCGLWVIRGKINHGRNNSKSNDRGRQIILFAEASAVLFFVHPYVHKIDGAVVHCGMCFDLNTIISLGLAPCF